MDELFFNPVFIQTLPQMSITQHFNTTTSMGRLTLPERRDNAQSKTLSC
jgi:hypothetical protein